MKLSFPEESRSTLTEGLDRIIQLVDFQVQRGTSRQAGAVAGVLVGLTQKEIGTRWVEEVVSQQAISQHFESAGLDPVSDTIQYVEGILPEILYLILSVNYPYLKSLGSAGLLFRISSMVSRTSIVS